MSLTYDATDGPIVSGRAAGLVTDGITDGLDEVGRFAVAEVKMIGRRSFRNPTGHYLGQVTYQDRADDVLVWDQGVIYGHWLEGTGRRNRVSRFKGYRMWRQAAERVRRMARETVEAHIERALRRGR